MSKFTTAFKAFWAILSSQDKADAWNALDTSKALAEPAAQAAEASQAPETPSPHSAESDAAEAVHTLAILQRESRLIDFLFEDLDGCDDDQIGAAVRKIHDDAQAALKKYFAITPIQNAVEGDTVSVPADFDNRRIRLAGKPAGAPPFKGTLVHKGWRAAQVKLPVVSGAVDPSVIAPAEIEIG